MAGTLQLMREMWYSRRNVGVHSIGLLAPAPCLDGCPTLLRFFIFIFYVPLGRPQPQWPSAPGSLIGGDKKALWQYRLVYR